MLNARTLECIEKAKELMAETSADSLRCATVELRIGIQYLLYQLISGYQDEVPDDIPSSKWRPLEIINALLEWEPHSDQDAAIGLSSASQLNGAPTSVKGGKASHKQLLKLYHRLGSYLRAPASPGEHDLRKWRSDLKKTINALKQYQDNEEEDWTEQPRKLSVIREALDELIDQRWYSRHCSLADEVESGEVRVVDKVDHPSDWSDPNLINREFWEQAEEKARHLKKKYGTDKVGPSDDFEWGMIDGKVAALRWVLGAAWHFQSVADEVAQTVAEHGWQAIDIRDASPPFLYTCGLMTTFEHPELIIFGLDVGKAYDIIAAMVNGLRSGQSFAKPGKHDRVTDMWPIAVRKVHPIQHRFYFGYALGHWWDLGNGGSLEAMQVFWPDAHGRYPFDLGCDRTVYESQPRLDLDVPPSNR
jgi:hypothetical protein